MENWLIYWADFDAERQAYGWPPPSPTERPFGWWRTSNAWLKDNLCHGDRLWLFTSGKLCGYLDEPRIYQTFLPEVLLFDECDDNPDFNRPNHPASRWKFRLWVQEEGGLAIDPPLLVEDIIFPDPRAFPPSGGQTVGERLQRPRKLKTSALRTLRERLTSSGIDLID
jgi:hypothetical protein